MKIVIIKYNAGNTKSVEHALHRLGINAIITDDKDAIQAADKVIFPGVGHASPTMQYLKDRQLDIVIKNLKQPVLGICLGQQLMCSHSEEGNIDCLGIFDEKVLKFQPALTSGNEFKVPHMGWNSIYDLKNLLFKGIQENSFTYFVHSYYVETGQHTIATCNYVLPFSAAIQKDNFYAVQFHPEKSADVGSKILQNFLELS